MTYTTIFEKLLCILNIIGTSWVYIAFSLISILLLILLGMKKISKKTCFILITLATKLVLGYTVYIYYDPISKMINSIVDNIFLNIYFPSAYAYLFILLSIDIITIVNILKPRAEKIYKIVNSICLIITNFILALILEIIAKNNIDIFAKESLFSNKNLITLLEFSVNIFIIWIISLSAIYIINNITERIVIARENKKLVSEPAITITNELVIDETKLKEEYQTPNEKQQVLENPVSAIITKDQYKFIPNFTISVNDIEPNTEETNIITTPIIENITPVIEPVKSVIEPITQILEPVTLIVEEPKNTFIPTTNTINNTEEQKYSYSYSYNNSFDLSAFIPKKQEVKPITVNNNNLVFEQIIKNELPIIEKPKQEIINIEEEKNTYTLNDYKIFNQMLKDIREHNQSNSITIDKNLEYRLITKYSTKNYNMFKNMLKIYSN